MKKIEAFFNCGRWIWKCPQDNCNAANLINPGDEMGYCGEVHCYPDKFAMNEFVINGAIVRGYDKKKQDQAKRKAWADKKVYKMVFPENYNEIVDFLRSRNEEHMSWEVGQTIEDLQLENDTHPKLKYMANKITEEKTKPKTERVEDKPLPELSDKVLRRIL